MAPVPPSLDAPAVAGASEGAAEAQVWDLLDLRQAGSVPNVYVEWDSELEDCVRTTVLLPPE